MIEVNLGDDDDAALVPTVSSAKPAENEEHEGFSTGAIASDERVEPGRRSGSGGFLGKVKARASETARGVMGNQQVQAGVGFVKDASKVISDQGHQGIKMVKGKTKELAESKEVKKGIGFVKDKTKEFKELGVVKNTTKEFKELGAAVAETADLMSRRWGAGGGEVERRPATVWRGGAGVAGAREMLGLDSPGEPWKNTEIQAIEEITIPARGVHTIAHAVSKGSRLRWVFCVKEHSVEFGVRTRAFRAGEGSIEEEVLPLTKYGCTETIQGSWVADENWTVDLLFDNRTSVLRPKCVAYAVGVEPPGCGGATAGGSTASSAPPASVAAPAPAAAIRQAELDAEDLLGGPPPPVFGGAAASPPAAQPAPLDDGPAAGGPAANCGAQAGQAPAVGSLAQLDLTAPVPAPVPDPAPAVGPLAQLDLTAPVPAPAPAPAPAQVPAAVPAMAPAVVPAVVPASVAAPARGAGAGQAKPPTDAAFEDLWGSLLDEDDLPPGGQPAAGKSNGTVAGDLL
uniref:GOLD domain-containing protein n=1 Tax=Alexandrium monilatum TaxID=311494 RepID=A0A7S4PWY4_9DINO